jgi:hypothetical protein
MWSEYKSPATLKDMLKAASVYAGPEKTGLHALIKNSLSDKVRVVDVESALPARITARPLPKTGRLPKGISTVSMS